MKNKSLIRYAFEFEDVKKNTNVRLLQRLFEDYFVITMQLRKQTFPKSTENLVNQYKENDCSGTAPCLDI